MKKNRKKQIQKAKQYCEENKQTLQIMACDQYKGLSEEEKDKNREYVRNGYQNISGEDTQN